MDIHSEKKSEEQVYILLGRIKEKYGVYIGSKSVSRLATFVSGYECAMVDITGHHPHFDVMFQRFMCEKYGRLLEKHWSRVLLEHYSEEEAFDKFFEYWEEMNNQEVDI